MSFTLILGGVRSGKSAYAVRTVSEHADRPVTFIATAPRIDGDADLDRRIAAHRDERPSQWGLIEEPIALATAIASVPDDIVIVDCLTLWVSNLMWRDDDADTISTLTAELLSVIAGRHHPTLVITNEVGLGVHPESELGRRFSEILGRVNQAAMATADRRLMLVAGQAVALHDPPRGLS